MQPKQLALCQWAPGAPLNAPQNIKINLVTFWTKIPPN